MESQIPLTAAVVTLLLFVLGLSYNAGKHINRIDHLEEFKTEIKNSMNSLHGHLTRIENLIRIGNEDT